MTTLETLRATFRALRAQALRTMTAAEFDARVRRLAFELSDGADELLPRDYIAAAHEILGA